MDHNLHICLSLCFVCAFSAMGVWDFWSDAIGWFKNSSYWYLAYFNRERFVIDLSILMCKQIQFDITCSCMCSCLHITISSTFMCIEKCIDSSCQCLCLVDKYFIWSQKKKETKNYKFFLELVQEVKENEGTIITDAILKQAILRWHIMLPMIMSGLCPG